MPKMYLYDKGIINRFKLFAMSIYEFLLVPFIFLFY